MPTVPVTATLASALTPNRETTLTLDIPEQVIIEEAFGSIRMGGEVAPLAAANKGADGRFSVNMHFWACGVWTTRPIQFDLDHFEQKTPFLIYITTP